MYRRDSELEPHNPGENQPTWLRGLGTAVFVPENFEPEYRYPVVVWLEASGAGFEARTWFPLITSRNTLAISLRPPRPGRRGWGTSRCHHRQALKYVGSSLAEVTAEVLVHPRRIFLAGREDGAAMAADLLCMKPEHFAGAILIDPTFGTARKPFDSRLDGRSSPALVATRQDADLQTLRNRCGSHLEIETVNGLTKTAFARTINSWLMRHVGSAAGGSVGSL